MAENLLEERLMATLEAPPWQHVERQLKHAARELQIADTLGWEATSDGKKLNIRANFKQNQLEGRVIIRYGPGSGMKPHGARST